MHRLFKQVFTGTIIAAMICGSAINASAVEANNQSANPSTIQETSVSAIDYTHIQEGFVQVRYTGKTNKSISTMVSKDGMSYIYPLTPGNHWDILALTEGSGTYTIGIYEHGQDNEPLPIQAVTFSVSFSNALEPFRDSTTLVNYDDAPNTCATAAEVTEGLSNDRVKAAAIHNYIIDRLSKGEASVTTSDATGESIQDSTFETNEVICLAHHALMCAICAASAPQ